MNRTYVITGTSRGIGLEMTRQLLASGQAVIALARKPTESRGLAELREKHGDRLEIYAVDVDQDDQVAAFMRELGANRRVDVLINNAGVYGEQANLEDLSLETMLQTLATNSVAPVRLARALLPNLAKSDQPKVAHITSLMGSIADNESGGSYAYRMSKAALNMFNKSFSIDYPKITSLVIHPGWVQTDMGGSSAPTSVSDSARGILAQIQGASKKDSGRFVDFEGEPLDW